MYVHVPIRFLSFLEFHFAIPFLVRHTKLDTILSAANWKLDPADLSALTSMTNSPSDMQTARCTGTYALQVSVCRSIRTDSVRLTRSMVVLIFRNAALKDQFLRPRLAYRPTRNRLFIVLCACVHVQAESCTCWVMQWVTSHNIYVGLFFWGDVVN